MRVSGFTIVRNAVKLDYPLRESVLSALPLCDEFVISCGDCEDGTPSLCEKIARESGGKVSVFYSPWDLNDQRHGNQIKAQTDIALKRCRGPWALYIQADEVLHEDDLDLIRQSMMQADAHEDVEGILFDYVHFYGDYAHFVVGRNWYRCEVRAFKIRPGVSSFRDAQGFRCFGKRLRVLQSKARVFHYGYVRKLDSLMEKSIQMARWWGEEPVTDEARLCFRRHVGLRRFIGTHPFVMAARVRQNHQYVDPSKCRRIWDKDEVKNALTLLWESLVPFRIGEFRNYSVVGAKNKRGGWCDRASLW